MMTLFDGEQILKAYAKNVEDNKEKKTERKTVAKRRMEQKSCAFLRGKENVHARKHKKELLEERRPHLKKT